MMPKSAPLTFPLSKFADLTSNASVLRYGIELDSYPAEQAPQRIQNVIQGMARLAGSRRQRATCSPNSTRLGNR